MSPEDIISALVEIRKERGVSRRELARILDASPNSVEAWEYMTVPPPSLPKIVKWAEALGYHFDLHLIDKKREEAE